MSEETFIAALGMVTGTVITLGLPLVFVYARRIWKRDSNATPQASYQTDVRLERIEHAIDAMAVEVERISEGQRFVTKLLADREKVAIPTTRHEA